jgi:hypothetical protein
LRQDLNYVAQAGLEFGILLPQPPEYWDYRCVSPCPADTCKFLILVPTFQRVYVCVCVCVCMRVSGKISPSNPSLQGSPALASPHLRPTALRIAL